VDGVSSGEADQGDTAMTEVEQLREALRQKQAVIDDLERRLEEMTSRLRSAEDELFAYSMGEMKAEDE